MIIDLLKKLKNKAYLALHPLRLACWRAQDEWYPRLTLLTRYRWDPWSCPGTDQFGVSPHVEPVAHAVPRRIFCVWSARNPMNDNRRRCLEVTGAMQYGLEFVLVTPDNVEEWVVDGHPLHDAYPYLSNVHRSDYLRCYLLHHHGGGYVDLKETLYPWGGVFDLLDGHPEWIGVGYRERGAMLTGRPPGRMRHLLRRHYSLLIGSGAMILRPQTAFTSHWYRCLNRELSRNLEELRRTPGGIYEEIEGYPLRWTQILADIFHPWNLVYSQFMGQDDRLLLDFEQSKYR